MAIRGTTYFYEVQLRNNYPTQIFTTSNGGKIILRKICVEPDREKIRSRDISGPTK